MTCFLKSLGKHFCFERFPYVFFTHSNLVKKVYTFADHCVSIREKVFDITRVVESLALFKVKL